MSCFLYIRRSTAKNILGGSMKKNERFAYIFAIIGLSILLGIFIYLGATGWFFRATLGRAVDPDIGTTQTISVKDTEAKALSFTFNGSIINGEKIRQNINIKNGEEKDLYVRARAILYTSQDGELEIEIGVNANWTEQEGYYYYDGILQSGATIGLGSYVQIHEGYKFDSNKKYIINIIVETLDSSLDKEAVWMSNN